MDTVATKESVMGKIEELLPELNQMILERAKQVLDSGALDVESYKDNYLLPKIILSAMGSKIKWQYDPVLTKDKKTRNNLLHFL